MRAALAALLVLAIVRTAAADALPVIGWQIELRACRGHVCRLLVLPTEPGGAQYPCDAHAATIQARAAARMADAPKAERRRGPWSVRATCQSIRGLPRA